MRFIEIDGIWYAVRCCDDCPFFNNGAGFEYLHTCQHPAWDRKEYMTISEFKTHEMHDKLCPLRDSKPGEGGVIGGSLRRPSEHGGRQSGYEEEARMMDNTSTERGRRGEWLWQ